MSLVKAVSWEELNTEDADILLVAFGSMTRNIKAAMNELRKDGIKAGILRPITLSPFPTQRINEISKQVNNVIVVEMNMGQMVNDVKIAVEGNAKVDLINRPVGQWLSVEEITAGVRKVLENSYASV